MQLADTEAPRPYAIRYNPEKGQFEIRTRRMPSQGGTDTHPNPVYTDVVVKSFEHKITRIVDQASREERRVLLEELAAAKRRAQQAARCA